MYIKYMYEWAVSVELYKLSRKQWEINTEKSERCSVHIQWRKFFEAFYYQENESCFHKILQW